MTPAAIIASAWATEREMYSVPNRWPHSLIRWADGSQVIMKGTHEACQAHLDALCSAAVERALEAAGYVIVPREPTGAMLSAGFDARAGFEDAIYRAMLAAAPEGER